jgi:hypothetical protein
MLHLHINHNELPPEKRKVIENVRMKGRYPGGKEYIGSG